MPGVANWRRSRSRRRSPAPAPRLWSPPKAGAWRKTSRRRAARSSPLPVASKNPAAILANAWRLVKLIDNRNIDLVHARSRAPAWSALLATRRTLRPFVTTYHGAYGEVGPFKAAYNSVMAKGDRVIANSRFTAGVIAERHPRAKDRIRIIYRGVDKACSIPPRSTPRTSRSFGRGGVLRPRPRSYSMRRGSPASRVSAI